MMEADPLYVRRHLVFGWVMLSTFLMLGLVLEVLHGFKVQWYLSLANEARRLLWTLAHAHGVLLGLLNVVYALCLRNFQVRGRRSGVVSGLLAGGSLCLPAGFLLGGIVVHGGDPNVFILLSPIGGLMLAAGVPMAAREFTTGN